VVFLFVLALAMLNTLMTQNYKQKTGALPSQIILDLIQAGFITGAKEENVKPASLDLTISSEVYKVDGVFQPNVGQTVKEVLGSIKKKKHDLKDPMLCNQMYIVRLNESLALPTNVYAYCNPKSTSGRIDVHVRVIADCVPRYDTISPAGWKGELWISVVPKTFPVIMYEGLSLNQIRFFNADMRLNDFELEIAMKKYKLLWDQSSGKPIAYNEVRIKDNDHSLILTLDLFSKNVGYVGIKNDKPVDLKNINFYKPNSFFKPIKKDGNFIHLKKNEFYILSTLESVRVPPELACEMVSMDDRSGEFRSHYAGFIDPGWGWGANGEGKGRPLTLEVRPFEDLIVWHGQPIAKIRFEKVAEIPQVIYDSIPSNYIQQSGTRLAKHFKVTN
jgi:dCTP deaminase